MAEANKDVIYIDVDDEITNVIEKVKESPEKIVALVLPKRATVLQSIVNMKLLHRASESSKKKLVLITSEAGLMPLAGAVGVHVAKNLQSKPEIPEAPDVAATSTETVIDQSELDDSEDGLDKEKTVGELAGVAAVSAAAVADDTSPKPPKKSKNKSSKKGGFKIPNFEKFRSKMFLIIVGVIGLIVFLWWAFFMAPSAKITVVTDTSTINEELTFIASTDAKQVDKADSVVPAEIAETKKVESETVTATGTKDVGEKATGSITMTAQNCSGITPPASVDAGWAVSTGGRTYVTNEQAAFTFDDIDGGCVIFVSSVAITAQKSGSQYNTSNATFTVAQRSDISAQGSASGGTTKEAKVVSQSDVNKAKASLADKGSDDAKAELQKQLEEAGYFVIQDSFKKADSETSSSPSVGSEATEATVTVSTTYQMTGVKQDDLDTLLKASVEDEIDTDKQQVVDTGLDAASFSVSGNAGSQEITVTTVVTAGPSFDMEAVKQEIAGKKESQIKTIIEANPGVTEVKVDFSPFWVSKTPSKVEKIEIVFEDAPDQKDE